MTSTTRERARRPESGAAKPTICTPASSCTATSSPSSPRDTRLAPPGHWLPPAGTGALVGVHPFGGFNLSGTDSKAGGPDYLLNFTQGKTVSERVTVLRAPGIGV